MLLSTRRSAIASRLARQERRPCSTITLPPADICAFVITEEQRPAGAARTGTNEATGGEANAGTGGVANADASGGSVTVGDVEGDNANMAIDASGGTANADASGGDNNVAIAGGGQIGDAAAQAVELSTLTLTLEGNVAAGEAGDLLGRHGRRSPPGIGSGAGPGRRRASGYRRHHRRGARLPDRGAAAGVRLVRPVHRPGGGHAVHPLADEWRRRLAAGVAGDQRAGTGPLRRARGRGPTSCSRRGRSGATPRATASTPTAMCWSSPGWSHTSGASSAAAREGASIHHVPVRL